MSPNSQKGEIDPNSMEYVEVIARDRVAKWEGGDRIASSGTATGDEYRLAKAYLSLVSDTRQTVTAFLGRRMSVKGGIDHETLAFNRQALLDKGYHELEIVALLWGGAPEQHVSPPCVAQSPEPEPHSYALLKLEGSERPLFFVMEERYGNRTEEGYEDSRRFFYEEHSCPTNWLHNCVAVIEAGGTDPHGFLTFVRSVPIPPSADKDDPCFEEDWQTLFPEAFVPAEKDTKEKA